MRQALDTALSRQWNGILTARSTRRSSGSASASDRRVIVGQGLQFDEEALSALVFTVVHDCGSFGVVLDSSAWSTRLASQISGCLHAIAAFQVLCLHPHHAAWSQEVHVLRAHPARRNGQLHGSALRSVRLTDLCPTEHKRSFVLVFLIPPLFGDLGELPHDFPLTLLGGPSHFHCPRRKERFDFAP